MADPFEALRDPLVPTAPDPAFARRLRARLERALALPRGAAMNVTMTEPTTSPEDVSEDGVIPYLSVADARRALDWYVDALGAQRRGEPIVMADGRIGHAELVVAGTVVMISDAYPEIGVVAPEPGAGATVTLHATVGDVDAVTDRAVSAGAALEREPADYPYGRNAVIRDPFGHRWMLAGPVLAGSAPASDDAEPMRQGDLTYVSLWVPDVERAARFFGSVLGWRYERDDDHAGQGRQIAGSTPHHGMWGDQERSSLFLCFAVDDVDAAIERVREAGGRAEAPIEEPYGLVANCVDDQGMPFAVWELPKDGIARRGPLNGARQGDVSYITMEVVDSAKARAFYGAVLGWSFHPGHVADGWGVEDVAPMVGMAGGSAQATGVPMYRVDDVDAAVERVRAAGGTATDPQRQPYGVTSECVDDQGTRFYLGNT